MMKYQCKTYLIDIEMKHAILSAGLGYSYSVLVLTVLEYWISGSRTLLVLVSSKVIVLVLRYSYEYWHEYWYLIVHLQCKHENHHTCEINSLTYHKGKVPEIDLFCYDWIYDTWGVIANSITSFNFVIIEKLTELLWWCLCLLLSFVQVHFPIQLLVNVWNFYFRL